MRNSLDVVGKVDIAAISLIRAGSAILHDLCSSCVDKDFDRRSRERLVAVHDEQGERPVPVAAAAGGSSPNRDGQGSEPADAFYME